MNRIKCVIAIILCSFYFVSRGQTSVSWETNLKKAVEKAKSENKLVFVNFVAEGLAPSVQFARQIGESQELAQYFESRFVSVLVDISKDQQVARQYQIQGLPTLLFLDSRGKEIKRLLGGVTPEHIIYWAQVLTGEKPSVDMLWEQYRQDKDNLALMGQILREMPIYSLGFGKVARSRGKVISNLLERETSRGDDQRERLWHHRALLSKVGGEKRPSGIRDQALRRVCENYSGSDVDFLFGFIREHFGQ